MHLPGKLCIGILEEDNPLKSFFRFKPMLIERDGSYVPFDEYERYGEQGCIRIVPDKNESFHFKTRMRQIGLFCVVDLRAHPDLNDKIRPNKNYREGGPEINASIIYSDVVRKPAPDMIFEILRAQADALLPEPHTPNVLLRDEAVFPERYAWETVEESDGRVRLIPTSRVCQPDTVQIFELTGFHDEQIAFAIVPSGKLDQIVDPQEMPARQEARPASEAKPSGGNAAAHLEAQQPADAAPTKPSQPSAEVPPAQESAAPAASVPVTPPDSHAASEPVVPDIQPEKPWIDPSMLDDLQLPEPHMTVHERMLAAQRGLNPRRGRSLQEVVDEKWQRSRMTQLGAAAAAVATGMPVQSPVEIAVNAVRNAWSQPELRTDLLQGLSGLEEFGASLQECREAVRQRDIELHLDALEARRLELLREQDQLSHANAELRQQLKEEILQAEADSFTEAVQKAEDARERQRQYEALAKDARAAAAQARQQVDALTGEALEGRLREIVANHSLFERIVAYSDGIAKRPPIVECEAPSLDAIVARIVDRFDAEGYSLSPSQAFNLCVCLGVGQSMLLSGAPGCGKTEAARLLFEALGWAQVDRCVSITPGTPDDALAQRLDALRIQPEAPCAIWVDDANAGHRQAEYWHMTNGLPAAWRFVAALQDSHAGHPIPAHLLDRAFMVRLAPLPEAAWKPVLKRKPADTKPVDLCAVFQNLPTAGDTAVPAACTERMAALRRALEAHGVTISRRALSDAWRFTGTMLQASSGAMEPMEALDLAIAQRILPALIAQAPLRALARIADMLNGLPASRALLDQPLPILI